MLHAPETQSGQIYWVLGSATGTAPGVPVDGSLLPLVPDAYTLATIATPNHGPFEKSLGVFGPDSFAGPNVVVPAATDPGLVGATLNHAFVAIDPLLGKVTFTSNPSTLTLVP